MKKIYSRPEWELTILETEDVISTSNGESHDPHGLLGGYAEGWEW